MIAVLFPFWAMVFNLFFPLIWTASHRLPLIDQPWKIMSIAQRDWANIGHPL
jgi:hypothetical protein